MPPITVYTLRPSSAVVDTDGLETVADLLQHIQATVGVPAECTRLLYRGRVLETQEKVGALPLCDGDYVHTLLFPDTIMCIACRARDGDETNHHTVAITPEETVRTLKFRLSLIINTGQTPASPEELRVFKGDGAELADDGATMRGCGINIHSELLWARRAVKEDVHEESV